MESVNIICVDDEDNILSALKRLLRRTNANIFTFNNPQTALESEALKTATIIISDMRMPFMQGDAFLEQSIRVNPEALRVLLTGYADVESTMNAVNRGNIWKYVQKPWNDEALINLVLDGIGIKKLKDENKRLTELTNQQNLELKDLNSSLEKKVEERTSQLKDANGKLRQNFLNTVKVFSSLIELKSTYNPGHGARVGDLSRKAAVQLNLTPDAINDIFLAGLLQDIGSQGIPNNILVKLDTQMSTQEYDLWKTHVVKGEQILMSIPELNNSARIIRQHHERFDGKGFPDKLKGDGILIGARILSAAVEFDLLVTSKLTGRKEDAETAARLLTAQAGGKLCPEAVAAVIAAVGTKLGEVNERVIDVLNLTAGMILSRDLINHEGILLLSAGHVLDESIIRKLGDVQRDNKKLTVWIKTDKS